MLHTIEPKRRPRCISTCASAAPASASSTINEKEKHKIFDEVFINVKAGTGGNGEVIESAKGKYVPNNKYKSGGNQPKKLWLPASDPADGADGGDVVLICDPSLDTLLHLHQRSKEYAAPRGANGNPALGSSGPKANAQIRKASTPPLELRVPPGTVVKRKSTGEVLGDLVFPGQRLTVARGGRGGVGIKAPSREGKIRELQKERKWAAEAGAEVVAVEDVNWKLDAKGRPGQQLGLHLLLRVVADVGIVGFPNAGKSSLLKRMTRASPEIAPYPFTTLMPNLGVMAAGGAAEEEVQHHASPILADLPGLIEGAHQGRGLGRMFLRHLRRTRILMHVVDASAEDPATDYWAVREELRMYNPEYVARPHVVALNKMDMEDAGGLRDEIKQELQASARRLQEDNPDSRVTPPAAIVSCSALTGAGVEALCAAVQRVLAGEQDEDGSWDRQDFPASTTAEPEATWQGQGQQYQRGDVNDEWDNDDVQEDRAADDDEDLWLMNLSEEELLRLEA